MALAIGRATISAALAIAAAMLSWSAARAAELPSLDPAPAPEVSAGDPAALPALPLAEKPSRTLLGVAATGETFERASLCLTQAIYYEAGFEPLAGREAVAQVVINRLKSPRFPKSVCGVVFQGAERATGCQFTFACDGSLSRRPEPLAWAEAREVAIQALQGTPVDRVGVSTHYHASWMSPYWQASMRETARIGGHIFYRSPDAPASLPAASVQYAGVEPNPALLQTPALLTAPAIARRRAGPVVGWAILAPTAPKPASSGSSASRRVDLALVVPRGWRPDVGR
jgi:hypothetical protein